MTNLKWKAPAVIAEHCQETLNVFVAYGEHSVPPLSLCVLLYRSKPLLSSFALCLSIFRYTWYTAKWRQQCTCGHKKRGYKATCGRKPGDVKQTVTRLSKREQNANSSKHWFYCQILDFWRTHKIKHPSASCYLTLPTEIEMHWNCHFVLGNNSGGHFARCYTLYCADTQTQRLVHAVCWNTSTEMNKNNIILCKYTTQFETKKSLCYNESLTKPGKMLALAESQPSWLPLYCDKIVLLAKPDHNCSLNTSATYNQSTATSICS